MNHKVSCVLLLVLLLGACYALPRPPTPKEYVSHPWPQQRVVTSPEEFGDVLKEVKASSKDFAVPLGDVFEKNVTKGRSDECISCNADSSKCCNKGTYCGRDTGAWAGCPVGKCCPIPRWQVLAYFAVQDDSASVQKRAREQIQEILDLDLDERNARFLIFYDFNNTIMPDDLKDRDGNSFYVYASKEKWSRWRYEDKDMNDVDTLSWLFFLSTDQLSLVFRRSLHFVGHAYPLGYGSDSGFVPPTRQVEGSQKTQRRSLGPHSKASADRRRSMKKPRDLDIFRLNAKEMASAFRANNLHSFDIIHFQACNFNLYSNAANLKTMMDSESSYLAWSQTYSNNALVDYSCYLRSSCASGSTFSVIDTVEKSYTEKAQSSSHPLSRVILEMSRWSYLDTYLGVLEDELKKSPSLRSRMRQARTNTPNYPIPKTDGMSLDLEQLVCNAAPYTQLCSDMEIGVAQVSRRLWSNEAFRKLSIQSNGVSVYFPAEYPKGWRLNTWDELAINREEDMWRRCFSLLFNDETYDNPVTGSYPSISESGSKKKRDALVPRYVVGLDFVSGISGVAGTTLFYGTPDFDGEIRILGEVAAYIDHNEDENSGSTSITFGGDVFYAKSSSTTGETIEVYHLETARVPGNDYFTFTIPFYIPAIGRVMLYEGVVRARPDPEADDIVSEQWIYVSGGLGDEDASYIPTEEPNDGDILFPIFAYWDDRVPGDWYYYENGDSFVWRAGDYLVVNGLDLSDTSYDDVRLYAATFTWTGEAVTSALLWNPQTGDFTDFLEANTLSKTGETGEVEDVSPSDVDVGMSGEEEMGVQEVGDAEPEEEEEEPSEDDSDSSCSCLVPTFWLLFYVVLGLCSLF